MRYDESMEMSYNTLGNYLKHEAPRFFNTKIIVIDASALLSIGITKTIKMQLSTEEYENFLKASGSTEIEIDLYFHNFLIDHLLTGHDPYEIAELLVSCMENDEIPTEVIDKISAVMLDYMDIYYDKLFGIVANYLDLNNLLHLGLEAIPTIEGDVGWLFKSCRAFLNPDDDGFIYVDIYIFEPKKGSS